jgi:hypothetical protein
VVFAKRPWGTSRGRLVWREPLVWAAADTFDLVSGISVPLTLYREHSVSREAALEAIREGPTRARRRGARGGAGTADAGARMKGRAV